MATNFDASPRRIWTGMTVPGKKMIKLLELGTGQLQRGRDLLTLYKSPGEALILAASAIELLPARGAQYGPALRDVRAAWEPRAF